MGLFLDAAAAWTSLKNVTYIIEAARKGELTRIELSFSDEDFPHLVGMQYADDIDFGIRKAEYYGKRLIPALLKKRINDRKIESSRNWMKISGRLTAILNLQNTLDGDYRITYFNKSKVRGYSKIDAEFVIKSTISDDVYFVFLDKRTCKYYCKSAFKKEQTDYTENQSSLTILRKIKVINDIPELLYIKSGYQPSTEI